MIRILRMTMELALICYEVRDCARISIDSCAFGAELDEDMFRKERLYCTRHVASQPSTIQFDEFPQRNAALHAGCIRIVRE